MPFFTASVTAIYSTFVVDNASEDYKETFQLMMELAKLKTYLSQ